MIVHLLRKPLSEGNVAANILKHGAGSLNVDATRIGTEVRVNPPAGNTLNGTVYAMSVYGMPQDAPSTVACGRWPANLVLEHLPGCLSTGTRKIEGKRGYPNGPGGKQYGFGDERGTRPNSWPGHADPDGTETIEAWECQPGCPVSDLDSQSGVLAPQGAQKRKDTKDSSFLGTGFGGATGSTFYGDTGGASRFFKQVKP
jgi:hypothetical protein